MFNTLVGWAARRKNISFVLLFAFVLSLGFTIPLKADAMTDKKGKNKSGKLTGPQSGRGQVGEWNTVSAFVEPVVASHVNVLPNGKLLAWGPNLRGTNNTQTVVQIWNPDPQCTSQCLQETVLSSTFENLYCSGHSFLPDGSLLITGGTPVPNTGSAIGISKAVLFDYATGTWSQLPEMNGKRWYPTNLAMPDGSALVWGGYSETVLINNQPHAQVNNVPQLLEKQSNGTYTWRSLNIRNPETAFRYYTWLHTLSSGKALATVGVSAKSYLVTVGGTFRYPKDYLFKYPLHATNSDYDGQLNDPHDAGSTIVFDKDQILAIGGSFDLPTRTVETLNLNNSTPQWQKVARLNIGRRHHNSTILADGKVLVTGGNKGNAFNNSCSQHAVKEAEMWDPANPGTADEDNNKWKLLASATQTRIYHSSAVLMPDGRVFTGGTTWLQADGNAVYPVPPAPNQQPCTSASQDNYTIELYSPPYLFNSDGTEATRPVISNAPSQVSYGQTIQFTVSGAGSGSKVNLVRLPSVTHSFNQNQGFNKLTPTVSGQTFSLTIPANRNELVPGHYMMFVLNSSGVPSKAKIIQVL